MLIHFSKMHGLGNDFIVIELLTQHLILNRDDIQKITHRHIGLGCDQLLLIDPPIRPEADFYYRIFNADGSEAEQCGNGARCVARFFYDAGLTDKTHLLADCEAGSVEFEVKSDRSVTVKMGYPTLLPFSPPSFCEYPVTLLSLGNPHLVVAVPNIHAAEIEMLYERLNALPEFVTDGINISMMQIIDRTNIQLRVFERGVGETLSCGSGACAAMIAGHHLGLLDACVAVSFSMGTLEIRWEGIQNNMISPVWLGGPTAHVFTGQFRL